MSVPEPATVPIFILCGGMGTRLGELTAQRPKPMVEIGDRPMLLHIMEWYGRFGFRRFVLCTGYLGDVISTYFAQFALHAADFTLDTAHNEISYHQRANMPDWSVTVAFTGARTMTGGRLARAAERYLSEAPHFGVTYGDGLTDADMASELAFHLSHDHVGTVLGVEPPSPYGRLSLQEDGSAAFAEKPRRGNSLINGGFFFFRRRFLDYLSPDEACILEREPLERLAAAGELRIYTHGGFWSCVDTVRDRDEVQGLWESGAAPWRP